jgi:plasmid stability protein
MKAITIHGLDEPLASALRKKASQEGESLNKLVKRLLGEAVGMKPRPKGRHRAEFAAFSGVWTEEDRKEFERRTAEFERVDPEDWR